MLKRNYVMDILLENAETYSEKMEIHALTEDKQAIINDRMVGNIYQSALKKRDVDFDNIPYTKGDIKKFHGYDNLIASLDIIEQLSKKFGIKIPELEIVGDAISNIRANKGTFERAFGLNIGFLEVYYNTLVCACIESTSLIISSYVEYVKTINTVEFRLKKGKGIQGNLSLDCLKEFNKSVKTGEFGKFAKGIMDKDKQNLLGGGMAAAAVVAIAASIVPIARELMYFIFESRMRVSEYLDQQAQFLEMNKFRLNSSSMPATERNAILSKQDTAIDKLETLSDKIRVNHQLADKNARNKLKQDNKQWTLNSVNDNQDGFMFM